MAPTPSDSEAPASAPTGIPRQDKAWKPATIALGSIFLAILLILAATLAIFIFRRRASLNKLPPEMRSTPYHPFRAQSSNSDRSGLLVNAAPRPEADKNNMFSRTRGSSVSLYVDTDHNDQRISMESVNLVPLHVTPNLESPTSMETNAPDEVNSNSSSGSGVSRVSRVSGGSSGRHSLSTMASLSSLGVGETDPPTDKLRRTSTSSMSSRYYANPSPRESLSTTPSPPVPQIPKIVHTPAL